MAVSFLTGQSDDGIYFCRWQRDFGRDSDDMDVKKISLRAPKR